MKLIFVQISKMNKFSTYFPANSRNCILSIYFTKEPFKISNLKIIIAVDFEEYEFFIVDEILFSESILCAHQHLKTV